MTQIQDLSGRLSKLQTQVSTGLKMTQPEDNPAAMGRLLILQSQSSQLTQYQENASHALEISQATSAALQQLKTISDRTSEITTLGASTESAASASSYATEINQLIEQAVQLGNSTLSGNYLFSGTAVATAPFGVDRDTNGDATLITYYGNTESASIQLSDTASIDPASSSDTNQGICDYINNLISLRDDLNSNDSTSVAALQSSLLANEDAIINAISEQGAVQMRIEVTQKQQESRATELDTLISNERDADLTESSVRLSQAQVAYQASLQSTAMIMNKSLLDYL